ncbi:MAG: flagellar type III secretion system pore protein FliP [Oxalobacter sp.]|nr:flagellar type III secretion system pore protein FliP [Oxalobacter sp.]
MKTRDDQVKSGKKQVVTLLAFFLLSLPLFAAAQGIPAFTATPASGGATHYSLSIQTLVFLTALTFIPAAFMLMTSFTRIIIVLSLLRQAIGTQGSPPNQVMVALALFMTFFVMSPVFNKIYDDAYKPFSENQITMVEAYEKGKVPLKAFMLKQTRKADLEMFLQMADIPAVQDEADLPMSVLIPSFATSELKTAFQIGFAIFLPFLIIDMVVASVLMSMGMMMVSPAIVALPFKLMLFVLVDGWHLIIGSLAQSFY